MGNFEQVLAFEQKRWGNRVTALYHVFEPLIRGSSMASEMEFMLPPNQFGIVGGSARSDANECTLAICLEVGAGQEVKKELIDEHLDLAGSFLDDVIMPRTAIKDGDHLKTLRKQYKKASKNVTSIKEATDVHVFTAGKISKLNRRKCKNHNGMMVHFYDLDDFESKAQGPDRYAEFEHLGGMPKVHLASSMDGDHDIYMGVVKGATIAGLFDQMGNSLLDTNVRLFLGEKSINRGIATTIKEAPKRFAAFNNGITMVATSAEVDDSGNVKSATDVSIVNGGQTSVSIFRAQRKGIDISDVTVPLKLIILHHDLPSTRKLMLKDISKFSNSQNTVSTVDRMIMNAPHEQLQEISLKEEFDVKGEGWFYQRKRGELDTLEMSNPIEYARRKARFPPSNIMEPSILGQCWITWWGVPELGASGRGKAFTAYHDRLQIRIAKGRWDAETHHKQSAALWMMYDHLFQYIGKNFGGLRGATWPHTIGLMSEYTRKRLDLVSIWKKGKLPAEVKYCLEAIARIVDEDIRKADEDQTNPLEWAKGPRCTSRLAGLPKPQEYEDHQDKLKTTGAEEVEDDNVEQHLRDIGTQKLWDGYWYYKDLHRDTYNGSFFRSVMMAFARNKVSDKQLMGILREWNKFVEDGYKEKYPGPTDYFAPQKVRK